MGISARCLEIECETLVRLLTKLLGRGFLRATRCWDDAVRASVYADNSLRAYPRATVEASDLEALCPWIEYAYHQFK